MMFDPDDLAETKAEEAFWDGMKMAAEMAEPPIVPEYRAYFDKEGVVTHFTATEFAPKPDNFIVLDTVQYAERDRGRWCIDETGKRLRVYFKGLSQVPLRKAIRTKTGWRTIKNNVNILVREDDDVKRKSP